MGDLDKATEQYWFNEVKRLKAQIKTQTADHIKEHQRIAAELKSLYTAVNHMMTRLGADGEISTRHEAADAVMGALHRIDDGVPKEQGNDNE